MLFKEGIRPEWEAFFYAFGFDLALRGCGERHGGSLHLPTQGLQLSLSVLVLWPGQSGRWAHRRVGPFLSSCRLFVG